MKKYLYQLIDLLNEQVVVQAARIRMLEAQQREVSFMELQCEDELHIHGNQYTIISKNRNERTMTLRWEP